MRLLRDRHAQLAYRRYLNFAVVESRLQQQHACVIVVCWRHLQEGGYPTNVIYTTDAHWLSYGSKWSVDNEVTGSGKDISNVYSLVVSHKMCVSQISLQLSPALSQLFQNSDIFDTGSDGSDNETAPPKSTTARLEPQEEVLAQEHTDVSASASRKKGDGRTQRKVFHGSIGRQLHSLSAEPEAKEV